VARSPFNDDDDDVDSDENDNSNYADYGNIDYDDNVDFNFDDDVIKKGVETNDRKSRLLPKLNKEIGLSGGTRSSFPFIPFVQSASITPAR
jgi:hypothetical protein